MAYYDALDTEWPTLTGTTAQKLASINALTVPSSPQKALLTPSQIINAIVPVDLASLTTAQIQMLALLLSGSVIDCSVGTTIRAAAQTIFAGKATTLANLSALVSPFDNATIPWWQANGYPGPFNANDLMAAGGLT